MVTAANREIENMHCGACETSAARAVSVLGFPSPLQTLLLPEGQDGSQQAAPLIKTLDK